MKLTTWKNKERYTHKQLGDLIGVSESHAIKLCRGDRMPNPETMTKIFEVTGGQVTANDFYDQPSIGEPATTGAEMEAGQ